MKHEPQISSPQTLLHWLTRTGIGPRRRCFQLITSGQVLVNGRIALDARTMINPRSDCIEASGRPAKQAEAKTYLKLNKPAGILSTRSDDRGRPTVIDLLPSAQKELRLFPVGRLDADTTGLLILTNDGELANRLTHPRFEVEKEYHARLSGPLLAAQRRDLELGIMLDGRRTAPAKVDQLRRAEAFSYTLRIREGRKRQIRRMIQVVGHTVLDLRRVRIGSVTLGNLELGEVKRMTSSEIASVKRLVQSIPTPRARPLR